MVNNNIAEEIIKMKKIVALILAAVLLCSCTLALAEIPPVPQRDNFASMTTKTKNGITSVTLSKPVDKLYVCWPYELKVEELGVSESLTASAYLFGHIYQPGVAKVVYIYVDGEQVEYPVGTKEDRAFITVQGNWIVCYNRKGELVGVAYAPAADIQAVRNIGFQQFGEVSTGRLVYNSLL